jgi:hypothetical protein
MAQLTPKTLRRRLAGPDWKITEHVLASIDRISVLVHRLEYSPVWGFRWLDTCRLEKPWQDELAKSASGFTMSDPIAELLSSGELAEGSHTLRAAAFQGFLASTLTGRTPLSTDATLLPLGDLVAPAWYEVLAGALGLNVRDVLAPELVGNPLDIRLLLATQPPTFPGVLSIPVAQRRRDEIVAARRPLLTPSSVPGPDRRFRATCRLWLPPGSTSTRICLTYAEPRRTGELVLVERELSPKADSFDLSIEFSPGGIDPDIRVNGGDWALPVRSLVPPRCDDRLAIVAEPGKVTSLAFLLDGSMSEPEFDEARDFLFGLAEDLAGSTPTLRLACVVYAEYLERVDQKRAVPWDYDVKLHRFSDLNGFRAFLTDLRPAGVVDDDPCDALELGLKRAQALTWEGDVRLLVLVGNSPPHPSYEERIRLGLLDRETEQHLGIKWEDELLEVCRCAQPGLRLGSAWVGAALPDRELDAYAKRVWHKFGADNIRLLDIGIEAQQSLADYLRRVREAVFVVDQPVALPLDRPLTVWMRRVRLAA